jgi:hypothetical protein
MLAPVDAQFVITINQSASIDPASAHGLCVTKNAA